jgi:hypothetical protein
VHDHVLEGRGTAVADVVLGQAREGVQQVLALALAAARREYLRAGSATRYA